MQTTQPNHIINVSDIPPADLGMYLQAHLSLCPTHRLQACSELPSLISQAYTVDKLCADKHIDLVTGVILFPERIQ